MHDILKFTGPKPSLIAVTLDYTTRRPIPPGPRCDWEAEVLVPAREFLKIAAQEQVKLTFMVAMGPYFWLQAHDPSLAQCMEKQWQEAAAAGHDVQLLLPRGPLPEPESASQRLDRVIQRAKEALELILRPADPDYRVTSFRAENCQVQPFRELYEVLAAHGFSCDSSVYHGGYSLAWGYDFRLAYSRHQPYFANAYDPQLKAPPSEAVLLELPFFTYRPGQRWSLDGPEGPRLAARLRRFLEEREQARARPENHRQRDLRRLLTRIYWRLGPAQRFVNLLLPRRAGDFLTLYGPEYLVTSDYFVMSGQTGGWHDFAAIARNWRQLQQMGRVKFLTLSQMSQCAREELCAKHRAPNEEIVYQVKEGYHDIMGENRNWPQSYYLQNLIPPGRQKLLDLGCGAGYWSDRLAGLHPEMEVIGIDCGVDFIAKASAKFAGPRVSFRLADFQSLPFADESFDCVYADNSLEHAFNVDATLKEIFRILRWEGVLVAAIPSDGRNPERIVLSHNWKTVPHEVRLRLAHLGFVNLEIWEVDSFKQLGMPPYPPSDHKMMYLRAWKRKP
jgi:SAM-dependent methyltransferase